MKSKSYWQKRFEQLENARHDVSEDLIDELDKEIRLAQKELEKEINNWYARIAVNNDISIREAKKLLKANELEEFKWTVEEYIKKGKENGINEKWLKELENASAKFHISRLEQIKLQTRQIIEQLYDNRLEKIDSHIERMYTDGYYKTLYELQKGIGVAFNVTAIDTRKLSIIMSKPWAADGKNFSDRIWTSKAQLINEVHTNLTRMCMLGEAPDKAINNIAKAMNVSKNQAARLVMTESAYFATESQKKAYNELDVEEYEILATLDYKTSDICRTMDGKHFKLSDMHIGVNAPPFHCYCRTVTIPYYDDEFTKNEKRWSRKNNGETELVDGNLTYKEWEKKYVQVGKQEKMPMRKINEKGYFRNEKEIKVATDEMNKMLDDIVKRKSCWNGKVKVIEPHEVPKAPSNGCIEIATDSSNATIIHELLHTRSYLPYGEKMYEKYWQIEEASVELLTREISLKEGYLISDAYPNVEALLRINEYAKIGTDNYKFALELFNVELPQRIEWLIQKINQADLSEEKISELFDILSKHLLNEEV